MPASASPQFRFLLRASALLLLMLTLWWWLLLTPLLAGLRLSTILALRLLPGGAISSGITVAPNTDWIVQVPIPPSIAAKDAVQQTFGRAPGAPPVKVRSFKIVIARQIPTFFTLSLPLFWALALAAPRGPRFWHSLVIGTALLSALAMFSLLTYTAYSIGTNMRLIAGGLSATLWAAAEYLNVNVAPYVAPLLIALWLYNELRSEIFSAGPVPGPAPVPAAKPHRRR